MSGETVLYVLIAIMVIGSIFGAIHPWLRRRAHHTSGGVSSLSAPAHRYRPTNRAPAPPVVERGSAALLLYRAAPLQLQRGAAESLTGKDEIIFALCPPV